MKTLVFLLLTSCAYGQSAPDVLAEVAKRPPLGLEDFERYALTANPTLKQANSLTKQTAASAEQAGLYPNPMVGYQGEQIRGGSYDGGEQGAFIQQTFVLGGKLALRRNVYRQQQREDEIGVRVQRYRITADVARSFYSALAAQQTVAARRQLLSIAASAVDTAHKLANVGQADAPDVLQAEVEAEQAGIDCTQAQRAFIGAFYTLASVAGKPELLVTPLNGDLEHAPQIDTAHIVDQIVQDSPLIKQAQQEVLRAQAELKSARRESVPDLQIHAGLQQNFEPINMNPRIPVGLQGFATAGIDLPIFNRNQGNVSADRAQVENAEAEVNRVELVVRQAAQVLLQNYLSAREAAERYRTQLIPRATRAHQLYLEKYQQMAGAYPQVLISQRTLFQLQLAYIQALQQVWTDAVMLQNYVLTSGLSAPGTAQNK